MRYPIGAGRMKQIWMAHRDFVSQYLEAQPQREAEKREQMKDILDAEMRIMQPMRNLHPMPVNEALELIEDEIVVALPETRTRLKRLEKKTAKMCGKDISRNYWHGIPPVTIYEGGRKGKKHIETKQSFTPLWEQYEIALEQVVEKKNSKPQAV